MTKSYSFHVRDSLWVAWSHTVPEEQRIDQRLKRLLVADLLGDPSILRETPTSEEPGVTPDVDAVLDATSPTGDSRETVGEGGGPA